MRKDEPIGKRFVGGVTTAETKNGKPVKKKKGSSSSPSPSPSQSSAAKEKAEENGLCT